MSGNTICIVSRAVRIFGAAVVALLMSASVADDDSLRVMSFNIRYGTANDGPDHWVARDQFVTDVIQTFDPDLLGTQETLGFQAQYLRNALPHMAYVGSSRDRNPDGEQCGVLYRKDRFEQLESGQFWLSEMPDEKFSQSWDSSLPRIACWVKLQDRSTGRRLLFVNTHFDHQGAVARRESAAVLRRFVEAQPTDLPVIVTGDFNCAEGSEPYRRLLSSVRLMDTFRSAYPEKQPLEGTFNGFRGTADGGRIDWILCAPDLKIRSAAIIRTDRNGRYPSDHFPVTAELIFP
ncbi:MAG: endonuclease/exonuclease/phosphatase family protein [Planctomycetaceae bacterium]